MIFTCVFLTVLPCAIRLYFNKYSLKGWVFGFFEDLFVACQQLAILYFTNELFFILVSLLQIVYLVDAFLFSKMGIRLNLAHFGFLKSPHLFFDSAVAMGLTKWLSFSVLAIGATYLMLITTFSKSSPLILVLAIPLFFAHKWVKQNSHNILLLLELQLFSKPSKIVQLPSVPDALIPKCEQFTKTDPLKYPLLKLTEGFKGPLQCKVEKGRPNNIIFIFLESFRADNVGSLGKEIGVTPHFDALTKKGLFFTKFYANGIITADALWASLLGVPPIYMSPDNCLLWKNLSANFKDLPLITLPTLLQKEGYYNLFIDGSSWSLGSEGQFLKNHGVHELLGKEDLIDLYGTNSSTSWGIHDEHLFSFSAKKIAENQSKPLFTSIFTISNHDPWKAPPNYNLNPFKEIKDPVYQRFLQTMHYTDHCLNNFILDLETRGLLKDSLLFILGDHGVSLNNNPNRANSKRTVYEEGIHIPLLIYGEGKIREPKVISDLGSQVDLFPTVMDLLDLKGLNHSVGTSLLRKTSDRILFFNNGPYLGNSFALRKDDDKFHLDTLKECATSLFDLSNDKEELTPLDNPEKTKAYKTILEDVSNFLTTLFRQKAFTFDQRETLAPSLDIDEPTLKDELLRSSKISSINLNHCTKISDSGFKEVAKKGSHLKSFQGKNCLISDHGVELIAKHCPKLELLNLSHCYLISDLGLQAISDNLPLLKSLDLSYNDEIKGDFLPHKQTSWLFGEFIGCTRIRDEGLHNITHIAPLLKKLSLSCNALTDDGMSSALLQLSHLTSLRLSNGPHLTGNFLKNLSINHLSIDTAHRLKNKSLLFLKDQPLYSLELSEAYQISDEILSSLDHLPLETLILTGATLSDNAIPALKKFPLKALTLSPCTNFTKLGLTELLHLDIPFLVLAGCNPAFKPYLTRLTQSHKKPIELYLSF